jgi:arylsulfatase A
MMNSLKRCMIGLVSAVSTVGLAGQPTAPVTPNIVVILADDLGYGSLNCYGAPTNFIRTPNFDRLAREGVRFTDAHTPASVCSPTRYALLTGRYGWRTDLKWGVVGMFDPLQIETNRLTLASLLKQKDYSTAAIGKWHLGFGTTNKLPAKFTTALRPGPNDLGFDYFFGIPHNHNDPTGVYLENDGVQGLRSAAMKPYGMTFYGAPFMGIDAPQREEEQVMRVLTDKAIDWMKRQDSAKPFFLYFAPVAVHHPCTPSARTKGTSGCGPYGDWIHELDLSVGRLLDTLDQNGQAKNTLVILTSDNGGVVTPLAYEPEAAAMAAGFRACGALRGGKHSIFEGGTRVPYIVRWPGKIKPGRVCDETINLVDTLATVAALVKEPLPPPREGAEDSFNVLPALLDERISDSSHVHNNLVVGQASPRRSPPGTKAGEPVSDLSPSPDPQAPRHLRVGEARPTQLANDNPRGKPLRPHLITHNTAGVYAIRKGPWKWIEGKPAQPGQEKVKKDDYHEQLYNLERDPSETTNVLDQFPEVAAELRQLLDRSRNAAYTRDVE